tara:strand:- start:93 stop:329 length:237 start_codon:yes stop_codon:yes gene_type:complete
MCEIHERPSTSVLGFFMQINMTPKDITLLHIPVDKPTLLNQCGTLSTVYPPSVSEEDYQALENDQWQRDQDELENESR